MPARRLYDPVCSVKDCDQPHRAKGYCSMHYARWQRNGAPVIRKVRKARARRPPGVCTVVGCGRPSRSPGSAFCTLHKQRVYKRGMVGSPSRERREHGAGSISAGYIIHSVGDGRGVGAHRLIMERLLGRKLRAGETVHHRNGIRDDNRDANLELWIIPQPGGQRVVDLVQWVISQYPEEIVRLQNGRSRRRVRVHPDQGSLL